MFVKTFQIKYLRRQIQKLGIFDKPQQNIELIINLKIRLKN